MKSSKIYFFKTEKNARSSASHLSQSSFREFETLDARRIDMYDRLPRDIQYCQIVDRIPDNSPELMANRCASRSPADPTSHPEYEMTR